MRHTKVAGGISFSPINEAGILTHLPPPHLAIEAPIRNSVDPIAHKARNHQTLPNFALSPELCITTHSSNDTAHRRQNGTFMAATILTDAQSIPFHARFTKAILFRMFCVRTMAVFAIENDVTFFFLRIESLWGGLEKMALSQHQTFRNTSYAIVKMRIRLTAWDLGN